MNERDIAPDDPHDAADAAPPVRAYVARTLRAEVDLLERLLATTPSGDAVPATPMPRNLHDRPHVVKLIESRVGGRIITIMQHASWALRKRVVRLRHLRARLRRLGAREAVQAVGAPAGDDVAA
ncbi:hypothetical protein, partial [Acidisphaera rubrifaciens]|uniref:hypothetical protein n=1 Tax=Acidisphaera rubrifaciens TaxID=50715 RepID=UPI000662A818